MVTTPSCSLRNTQTSLWPLGQTAFFTQFQKGEEERGLQCLRCSAVSRVSVFPGWTLLYQKQQRHIGDERVTVLLYVHK